MLKRILDDRQEALLKEQRACLSDLRVALARFDAKADHQSTLDRSIRQLDEFFLLVVIGEFNAGKSAFINALLGESILREGVTPTTAQVNVLRYGDAAGREVVEEQLEVLTAPIDLLRDIHIVDTPGTNAINREHERITADFVPRSDLVLFITSVDRPFTESERAFLERTRDWGKKIVVVLNKVDILDAGQEVEEVREFVAKSAQQLLGLTPEIFPVSARLAMKAKQGDSSLWEASGFAALERYVQDTLDEGGRVRLKLLNPLGVGLHLCGVYLAETRTQIDVLKQDFGMLEDVDRQLALYEEDMEREFRLRLADLGKILVEMERRGHHYFDDLMRLSRVVELLNTSLIQRGFERHVVADVPQQIERRVSQLIDWLVESDFRQWQAVRSHLSHRQQEYRDRIVGDDETSGFRYDREQLVETVGRDVQRVVETYDRTREAKQIANGARGAVAAVAAVEAGALGLGTLVALLTTSLAVDLSGIAVAGALAVVGLFIVPARRRRAKREMAEKVVEMRDSLETALRSQFESELARSVSRIREGIAPYGRFVRAERAKLDGSQTDFERLHLELERLKSKVDQL
ncbi:MAG: dynamin family protein [Vicinamibacterales bacterium]|jgi:small GTP-binding protein|nr:dynamin [Acidobacteriota bacterium]MDP7339469.1 dynamin family protein [Vicinamibacterales bacterium]MDP7479488.1 dynamin family protein [Vicinamibacterales bacterium]MDP7671129.1 dynamin family protein [Vicinamibacterales bacterium]HJO39919.1 dynamin family protein [Vicinamibacterales bacterium]|tara:strand:+ start:2338 stop:4071 length:1734 start_codon:yes stop_codon:yes gene_type:complete